MSDLPQFDKLNSEVKKWAAITAAMMQNKVRSMTNNEKHVYLRTSLLTKKSYGYPERLADSIKSRIVLRDGVSERITFPFNKYGYFLTTGGSKGHKSKDNPRQKVEWFKFVFEKRFDELADIVAENYADATINSQMMIKIGQNLPG